MIQSDTFQVIFAVGALITGTILTDQFRKNVLEADIIRLNDGSEYF